MAHQKQRAALQAALRFCFGLAYLGDYRLWELKQSLQYTGRSPRGRNGTMVSVPHWAQTTGCISRGALPNPPRSWFLRALRHSGQRLGSLVYPLDAKNSCSPDVKVKGEPHSTQVRLLSDMAIFRITSELIWNRLSPGHPRQKSKQFPPGTLNLLVGIL